jgi:hypothetical protein
MSNAFPFDHLTLAEVEEFDRMLADGFAHRRGWGVKPRFMELARKRHRPLYDDEHGEDAA